ncbi:MAG: class I SAM-dependent methyltransferase [Chlorobiaceae bacterium]|nr:class I SAM-dependent methyltransferase [Chlorobiaceae bacterium]
MACSGDFACTVFRNSFRRRTVKENRNAVCPVELAGSLDSRIRRWLQNPRKMLEPYVREGMAVLDFGCGPGFFTVEMASLVGATGHVIAADLQNGMLEKVRAKVAGTVFEKRVELHQCQSHGIGLSRRLDFVLAFYVVHELPDAFGFFSEVRQLLQRGGQMLVVEPPIHVSKTAFEKTLSNARRAGFTVAARPRMIANKAVVFQPC